MAENERPEVSVDFVVEGYDDDSRTCSAALQSLSTSRALPQPSSFTSTSSPSLRTAVAAAYGAALRSEVNKLNKSPQILRGSFSAVWTATIARVVAIFSIFRDLQDLHSFAPLRPQNFSKKHVTILVILNNYSFKISQNCI